MHVYHKFRSIEIPGFDCILVQSLSLKSAVSFTGDYIAAFNHVLLPIAYEYAPDLIIVSAGFDAADGAPLVVCHPDCLHCALTRSDSCACHSRQLQLLAG